MTPPSETICARRRSPEAIGKWVAVASCVVALWFPVTGSAAADGGWNGSLTLGLDYQGWTDIDDPQGEFDFVHPSVVLQAAHPPSADSRWGVAVQTSYRAFTYRFDGLAVGDPWEDVHVFRLAPRLLFAIDEKWSLFAGPIGELSAESGADLGESIRGGASFGVQWRPNDRLSIGLGVLGINVLAEDFLIQPVVVIDWRINDAWRFTTQSWTSRGGRLSLIYSFLDDWDVSLSAGRERERFRIDRGPGGIGDGVGEESSLPVTLAVGHTLRNGVRVEAYGGGVFAGELRVEDERGNNVAVSDFDQSFYFGAALTLPF